MTASNKNHNSQDQEYERPSDLVVATIWGLFFVLLIGTSLISLLISKSMLAGVH